MRDRVRHQLDTQGFAVIDVDDQLFTGEEWDLLDQGITDEHMPYEKVITGDAGEPNCVEVGRLMTDIEHPQIVNRKASEPILNVLGSPDRLKFFSDIVGCDSVSLRRAQINRMPSGSYIGTHVDQDSNPDYTIAIVLQFGSSFTGGEFVVHGKDGSVISIAPRYRSVIISRCDWAHEVLPVKSGVRTSLVFFVSGYSGQNRRVDRMESVLA